MFTSNLLFHLLAKIDSQNICNLRFSLRPINHGLQHASSPSARGGVPKGGGGPMCPKQNILPNIGQLFNFK